MYCKEVETRLPPCVISEHVYGSFLKSRVCRTNPGRRLRPDVQPWSLESTPSEMYLPVVRGGSTQRPTTHQPHFGSKVDAARSGRLRAGTAERGVQHSRESARRLALHAAERDACEALRDVRLLASQPDNGPALASREREAAGRARGLRHLTQAWPVGSSKESSAHGLRSDNSPRDQGAELTPTPSRPNSLPSRARRSRARYIFISRYAPYTYRIANSNHNSN